MRKYGVVIVDDEIDSQITLRSFLQEYCPFVELIGTYSSVKECEEGLISVRPDILLLDVSLSDGNGFDILEKVSLPNTKVIMITAHEQFAVKAFKFKVDDYLLKPINPINLKKSIKDLIEEIESIGLREKEEGEVELSKLKKLGIPSKDKLHITTLGDIVRCEADGNYTVVFIKNDTRIVVAKTIKIFEETLAENGFIRVHQSHLINQNHIETVLLKKSAICLKNGNLIPISRKYKSQVVAKFKLKLI